MCDVINDGHRLELQWPPSEEREVVPGRDGDGGGGGHEG